MTKNNPARKAALKESTTNPSDPVEDMKPAVLFLPVRLLTHNIRYATTSPFKGEELWSIRAPRILSELRYNTLHNAESFICLQEVLHNQTVDVYSGLNSKPDDKWSFIGVGRDDGKEAGEYSPIFYRPDTWDLISNETKWLSETPDVPSKGWDAASIRIVNIGVFQHRISKQQVLVMNTHMDDQGSQSRLEGAKQIVKYIERYMSRSKHPLHVILAGDFNSESDEEAYGVFSAQDSPVTDLRNFVPPEERYGNNNTFTGFGYEDDLQIKRIDYIFVGKKSGWNIRGYSVLENRFDDGVYNSDHRAVVGDMSLGKQGRWY